MSDTPRTNFVAHATGDSEWDRSINRFGRMMAHACILERELAAAQAEIAEMKDQMTCALLKAQEARYWSGKLLREDSARMERRYIWAINALMAKDYGEPDVTQSSPLPPA